MERLGSMFWSGVTALALLGMLSSIAGPALAGPIVRITQPAHGQVVQGQILINVAYRTDSDQPITRIELLIDERLVRQYTLASPSFSGSQAFSWDFTAAAGSTHTISARAVDAAGAIGSATINVTVTGAVTSGGPDRIPPVINIYYPAQGAVLSGEVEIKAEATDNVGVKYVFFYIDGKLHKMIMNAPPFVDLWDTTRVADGPHVLQARAMDESENAGSSAEVTVIVRNHDMTTAPTEALQPYTGAQTPAAPTVGTGQPTVTQSQFATVQDEQPTIMAAAPADEAQVARVGYVPAIGDDAAGTRISQPRMLAALPTPVSTEETTVTTTSVTSSTGSEVQGPQIAAVEFEPRVTRPRTSIERAPSAATGVAVTLGGVVLEPSLVVSPQPEALAARTTVPVRSLVPSETLALDPAELESVVTSQVVTTAFEPATPGQRITTPDRRLATAQPVGAVEVTAEEVVGFSARDDFSGTMRIAVLPERATRAALPADGRITRPGEPIIAPVAAMSFEDVQVLFDNETLSLLTSPEIREGISIAPLREIFEHSDGILYWYPVEKRVRAVRPGTVLQIQIGDPAVRVNDTTRVLEVAPYIKQGRTMVPLQFIADTLNVTVTFNPQTGQICLTSNEF